MSDDFSPDLGGLTADYQILAELRHSARSRTYLARHIALNRDVTIRVVAVERDGGRHSLTHFASDARTLATMRHPNIVPVVEGRWLADGSLAIIRARVRGATLDDSIEAGERFSLARIASTLGQVQTAIMWARDNGISHRHLPGDAVEFQQGSGRVLVELDLSLDSAGRLPDAYDDGRTIGRLAYAMLAGRRVEAAGGEPLTDIRLDLSPRIIRELSMLENYDRAQPPHDPRILIGLLAGADAADVPAVAPERESAPAAPAAAAPSPPLRPRETKRRFNFGTWLIILAVLSTAAGAAGTLLFQHAPTVRPIATAKRGVHETVAAGEVAIPPAKPDTPTTVVVPTPPLDSPPVPPPAGRRHEPLQGTPKPTLPAPPAGSSKPADGSPGTPGRATSGLNSATDVCDSPDAADQHTCLAAAIERNDRSLNATYQRLIVGLRRRANVAATDPDPAVVEQLRKAQHTWVEAREAACHAVGEDPLYARGRAQCFADESIKRSRDLQQMLDALPPS